MRLEFPGHGGILPRLWGAASNCPPAGERGKTSRAHSIPVPAPAPAPSPAAPGHGASSRRFVPLDVEERLDGHLPHSAAGAHRDALQHRNRRPGHVCGFYRCAHLCRRPMDVGLLGCVHRLGRTGGPGLALLGSLSKLPDELHGGKSFRDAWGGSRGAGNGVCRC